MNRPFAQLILSLATFACMTSGARAEPMKIEVRRLPEATAAATALEREVGDPAVRANRRDGHHRCRICRRSDRGDIIVAPVTRIARSAQDQAAKEAEKAAKQAAQDAAKAAADLAKQQDDAAKNAKKAADDAVKAAGDITKDLQKKADEAAKAALDAIKKITG